MTRTESRADRLQAAHERLTEAVETIVSGDDWKRMLKVSAKFHRYSFNNQLLIFLQRPDATLVAGFRRWQDLGRQVRKGEKGIQILAPCRYRSQTADADATAAPGSAVEVAAAEGRPTADGFVIRGFRVAHVFDIRQTEGEPIEDLDAVRPKLLQGEAPEGLWDALVTQANAAGFEVVRDRRGSENGYCDFKSGQIGIRPDVEGLQAVKTLVHELAHALLHGGDVRPARDAAEIEVESVAFVVLDALGLASDDYSFPYVARWASGDAEVVKETAGRVVDCASRILTGVEREGGPGYWEPPSPTHTLSRTLARSARVTISRIPSMGSPLESAVA